MDRREIRQAMRWKRNQLNRTQQKTAAHALCRHSQNNLHFARRSRVALYLPNDGEINPRPLIKQLQKRNIQCFLPVLHPTRKNSLWFCEFKDNTPMRTNRFGINEPDFRKIPHVSPWTLSVVLFPLVAFDNQGGRLGMGGGFYDRTFSASRSEHYNLYKRVRLVGLAHHFQVVEKLPIEPWDVPLSAIATDHGVITA